VLEKEAESHRQSSPEVTSLRGSFTLRNNIRRILLTGGDTFKQRIHKRVFRSLDHFSADKYEMIFFY
jgi:hypothetical protein